MEHNKHIKEGIYSIDSESEEYSCEDVEERLYALEREFCDLREYVLELLQKQSSDSKEDLPLSKKQKKK